MSEKYTPELKNKLKHHLTPEKYQELYKASTTDSEIFWATMAKEQIDWITPWETTLHSDFEKAEFAWFKGGKLNVCANCVDRHLENRSDKIAIIWEGNEPGECRHITYKELHLEVCKAANVLKANGIKKGDRVAIYMPMVPELAISMLACARIGAIHSVVFAGFSANALKDRIIDAQCKMVITANEGLRADKVIPLKQTVDEAVKETASIKNVLVYKRTDTPTQMKAGRDIWWHEQMEDASIECPVEALDSEDPLFILYTSGSTGQPKGLVHTQAGYLLYTSTTHKYVFDYQEDDVYFCAADIGWITGHSYIVYGPLANGATTLMFESIPTYPTPDRYWDVIERHKVNSFYTAPTAIRAIEKEGNSWVEKHDLSSLRILGSVGEPINRDAWLWYYENIGKKSCALVDTWWQTETGGIMITPLPNVHDLKPGSALQPFFGIEPCIVDANGAQIDEIKAKGHLCIKRPWPSMARTIWGDHNRFKQTYYSQYPSMYFTGDAAQRDKDGDYWLLGRVDDVLNVSGHRIGTAEVESAIDSSSLVAEAAVVGIPHDIKGVGIYAFCIATSDSAITAKSEALVKQTVKNKIGGIAVPEKIFFVPGLPKTRSGKIMRRILRKIAQGDTTDLGDISTLADPSIVETLLKICC